MFKVYAMDRAIIVFSAAAIIGLRSGAACRQEAAIMSERPKRESSADARTNSSPTAAVTVQVVPIMSACPKKLTRGYLLGCLKLD